MISCKLCSELESPATAMAWNKPLFDSPNFVAIPSLGALVKGWILMVPKGHVISFGAMSPALIAEKDDFKQFLCSMLAECFGAVSAFEHGPGQEKRTIGCGVDHAHLHLVPLTFDLLAGVSPFLPNGVSWKSAGIEECQEAYQRGEDYLYLEQPVGSGLIATHGQFGGQLFRRAIAAQLGIGNQYNWREFNQVPTVMTTIQRVSDWASVNALSQRSQSVTR